MEKKNALALKRVLRSTNRGQVRLDDGRVGQRRNKNQQARSESAAIPRRQTASDLENPHQRLVAAA
jgi:hypothetical protein